MEPRHVTPSSDDCRWAWSRYKELVLASVEACADTDVAAPIFVHLLSTAVNEVAVNVERRAALIWCSVQFATVATLPHRPTDSVAEYFDVERFAEILADHDVLMETWATIQGRLDPPD